MTPISEDLILIIKENSPILQEGIDLSYTSLDDNDIKVLVDLLKDKKNLKLNLKGNNISEIGANYLSSLEITELDISNNMIGNIGARVLLDSKSIRKMYLDQNGVTKGILENNPNKNLKMTPEIIKTLRGKNFVRGTSLFPAELNRTDEICDQNLYTSASNTIQSEKNISSSLNNGIENKITELLEKIEREFHISKLSPEELDIFKQLIDKLGLKQEPIPSTNNI